MKNISYFRIFLTGIIALIVAGSCQKKYDSDLQLSRHFSPTWFNVTQRATNVEIQWAASLYTQGTEITYTIEVSKTNAFQTIDYTAQVDTNVITITDASLTVRQPYYARVRANELNGTAASNWAVTTQTFMILGEQIFQPVLSTDIIDNAVILKWRTTPGLTKIVITP